MLLSGADDTCFPLREEASCDGHFTPAFRPAGFDSPDPRQSGIGDRQAHQPSLTVMNVGLHAEGEKQKRQQTRQKQNEDEHGRHLLSRILLFPSCGVWMRAEEWAGMLDECSEKRYNNMYSPNDVCRRSP